MHWKSSYIMFLVLLSTKLALGKENEDINSTTVASVLEEIPSTEQGQIQLDAQLRTALLKALGDLENEDSSEEDEDDKNIKRAQASAITIFTSEEVNPKADANSKISSTNNELEEEAPSKVIAKNEESVTESEDDPTNESATESQETPSKESVTESEEDYSNESATESEEDPSQQKVELVVLQKSETLQGQSISSIEKDPLDPIKDAEQILTSASNSFISDESIRQNEARSISSKDLESTVENTNSKLNTYASINTIPTDEYKKPIKLNQVQTLPVDEPPFIRTYVRPLENNEVGDENTKTTDDKASGNKKEVASNADIVTQRPVEVSTEENEAKVEQVQFFSAPLVAAFTVHQDEQGQPQKVEPIFKNGLNPKLEEPRLAQVSSTSPQQPLQPTSPSPPFNNLDIQQKQTFLEIELEKLRNQQQNLQQRNNFANLPNINIVESNRQVLTQSSFNKAINQNFNQFDPVFTEPDRSIVTKLATIDPSNLLSQNSELFFNRFTPSEAILPKSKPIQIQNQNQIIQDPKQSPKTSNAGEVSLLPSITYDPLIEAGKLPKNAQFLPNKEPTGFHNYLKLPQLENQPKAGENNLVQPNPGLAQPGSNNLNIPQGPKYPFHGQNGINNHKQSIAGFNSNQVGQINQFSNQNRFLRQEQDTANPGLNQNTFSVVPAQQPFEPKHEFSYFPDNRFLRKPQQNFNLNNQNTNRYFRNNVEGQAGLNTQFNGQDQNRLFKAQNVDGHQSLQTFGFQALRGTGQGTRFFRSNQEGSSNSLQNFGFNQPQKFAQTNRILRSNPEGVLFSNQNGVFQTPVLQTYKYSNSFGFPNLPLK